MKTPKIASHRRATSYHSHIAGSRGNWFLTFAIICSLALLPMACGDSSTGTNGGGNGGGGGGNGGGGGTTIGTEPTFTNVVQIFETSCGGASCHISSSQSGVQLNNYANVTGSVGTQYGELVVKENDAAGSPLVDKIEPSPEHGNRMPQGGPFLSDSRITQIRDWIDNGANND